MSEKSNDLIYTIHKNVGETPLQAIELSREDLELASSVPMAYAGRLDPMAEGKLLVLTGEKCKSIKKFCGLDKEYKVSIVIGVSSDSHDVLGILRRPTSEIKPTRKDTFTEEYLSTALKNFSGPYSWPYPVLSSKTIQGKPLFQWFLEGRLDEIEIPESTGVIYSLKLINIYTIQADELKKRTLEKIHSLSIVTDASKRLGRDFRRHEILDSWNTWYKTSARELQVVEITCVASSGTYMRTLADELGEKLGTGALALEINRTKIGKYQKFGPWGFWLKKY